jgi:hypothetical protein
MGIQRVFLVFTQGNLDNIGAQLEYSPDKPNRCLVQETGISKDKKYRSKIIEATTVVHSLHVHYQLFLYLVSSTSSW